MKISDILRQLADVIDREDPGKPDASIQNAAGLAREYYGEAKQSWCQ